MVADLPFYLSIAGLSASLAGLAGLVAGLRRSEGLRPLDAFRLREIVEFAFANTLLALSLVPAATILGSVELAVRAVSIAALVYLVAVSVFLWRRLRQTSIALTTWVRVAAILDLAIVIAGGSALATGAPAGLQVLLLLLLARPMTVFLFVLGSFDTGPTDERTGA